MAPAPAPLSRAAAARAERFALRCSVIRPMLDPWDAAVLRHLCVNGPAVSSVVLAADLYGQRLGGTSLGWLGCELSLQRLNALGLVTYRLGYHEVFVQPRATRLGYGVADVEWRLPHEVGRPRLTDFPVGGDMTEYRRHGLTAEAASEIERMDLETHCEVYYEHADVHLQQLEDLWERRRRR